VPHDVAAPPPRRYKSSLEKRQADAARQRKHRRRQRRGSISITLEVIPDWLAALRRVRVLETGAVDKLSVANAIASVMRDLG
jgi:hypothetical protein